MNLQVRVRVDPSTDERDTGIQRTSALDARKGNAVIHLLARPLTGRQRYLKSVFAVNI